MSVRITPFSSPIISKFVFSPREHGQRQTIALSAAPLPCAYHSGHGRRLDQRKADAQQRHLGLHKEHS